MVQESVLRIKIDSRGAEKTAQRVRQELQGITTHGEYATKSMDAVSVGIRQLVGQMAGIVTVGAAINKMDVYTGINNKLKLVTNSQTELNQAMQDTFAIAQRSASSWSAVNDVYSKYMSNAKTLNLTQAQTARLTEITSKAVAISGSSTESAAGALFQYGQALDGNILRAEEYNSLVDGAGGLLTAMAKGLDVTRGELRQMMLDGKLTGEVITKALLKAGDSVDQLFNKTDTTVGQSLTVLSDSVTKFVGEAASGSGAATVLAESIGLLAKNLDLVADVALVGGVAMLTKTIVAQTIATHGSIAASVTRRNSLLSELEAQARLTAAEARRTASIAQYTQMQLADAKATAARMTGIQRLAYVQATVIPLEAKATQATAAHTAATNADTLAQEINNKARSRATMLLGMVGGPIGAITLGVAGLAAGYMYLKNRTAEANAKLEEQGKVAEKTKKELLSLKGVQLDVTKDDLATSFKAQNEELNKLNLAFNGFIRTVKNANEGNQEVKEISDQVHKGLMSQADAIERLNKLKLLTPEQKSQGLDLINSYDEAREKAQKNAEAQKVLGVEVKLAGNAAQNASPKIAGNTKELKENESAAQKAAKAQKDYFDSLHQNVLSANERLAYMNLGFSKEIIDQINKLQEAKQKALGDSVTAIITTDEIDQIVQAQKALDAVKDKEDEITEAKRKQNKESEKKYQYNQAELKMLQKVATLSAKYDLDGIGAKYGIPKNYLAGLMAQESKGNPNAVSPTGAIGYFQTTSAYRKDNGLSIADSKNLPVIAEVVAKNLAKAYKELGDWEAAIRSHNAGLAGSAQFAESGKIKGSVERNKEVANFAPSVNKWIVGLGGSALKNKGAADAIEDLKQYFEFLEEQAKSRKVLELEISTEVEKIRKNLKDKLIEIDKAGYSPEQAKELKAEYQARADNDIAIAQQALKTKLDDYGAFKKTESKLLEDSFNERKFYATRDLELSKEERKKAVALLDEQMKQEQALLMLAQETRLFQMREALMSETAAMQERYRLEREQILLNSKLSEEQKKREIALSKALQEEENRRRLNNAVQQWGGIQADMNGTGDQYRLEQERFGRIDASQDVFDAQLALAETVAEREAVWQAHHERMAQIETDFQAKSIGLQASYGAQFADIMMGMVSDSSSAYAALAGIQKGFNLFSTIMNGYTAISAAWASAPFPYNLPAVATTTMQTGVLQAAVSALSPKGFAHGGFTGYGGKYEPAGIVHKWEGVLTKEEMMAIGGPQGFEGLRKSIRNGSYADGGIVGINNAARDTHRVGMGAMNAINKGGSIQAEKQAQANAKVQAANPQPIESNVRVGIFDDRADMLNQMYGREGEKVVMYHLRRNGMLKP